MNVVIPLTRPHALPRQQYDEAAVAAGDRRGTVPERELAGTLLRSRRRADEAHAMATERNTSRATRTWAMAGWCCMRRSGCVHRGSLMIEARAWQPRAAVVSRFAAGRQRSRHRRSLIEPLTSCLRFPEWRPVKGRASLVGAPGRSDIALRNDADNGGWTVYATRDGPVDH